LTNQSFFEFSGTGNSAVDLEQARYPGGVAGCTAWDKFRLEFSTPF